MSLHHSPQPPAPSPDSVSSLLIWWYHPAPALSLSGALLAASSPTPPSSGAQAPAVQPRMNPRGTLKCKETTLSCAYTGNSYFSIQHIPSLLFSRSLSAALLLSASPAPSVAPASSPPLSSSSPRPPEPPSLSSLAPLSPSEHAAPAPSSPPPAESVVFSLALHFLARG